MGYSSSTTVELLLRIVAFHQLLAYLTFLPTFYTLSYHHSYIFFIVLVLYIYWSFISYFYSIITQLYSISSFTHLILTLSYFNLHSHRFSLVLGLFKYYVNSFTACVAVTRLLRVVFTLHLYCLFFTCIVCCVFIFPCMFLCASS